MRSRVLALAPALLTVAVFLHGNAPPAAATDDSTVHRAAIVVDLGNGEVKSACVRFRQASITGMDLLRAAHTDPVVQTYSGQGGAVCKLCGVGCNAGSACLTCHAPTYWQYWRSPGGTGTYQYSQTGAGNTAVHDGDVDGWSWSADERPPPFLTVAEACSGPNVYDYEPASASTTTTTAPSSSPPSTTTTTAAPVRGVTTTSPVFVRGGPATTAPATRSATPNTTSSAATSGGTGTGSTETTTSPAGTAVAAGPRASTPAANRRSAGGSAVPGLAAFAGLLGAILGWTAHLRRRRRRADGRGGAGPG